MNDEFIKQDEVMLRVITGRDDGCYVGLSSHGQCQTRVTFYSPYAGNRVVVSEVVPDNEIISFIEDHRDW